MSARIRSAIPDFDTHSPVRAIYSLREAHIAALQKGFSENQAVWSLDRHEGYDGYLTVLLTPPGEAAATLVISRNEEGFNLAASHGDDYRNLGSFESVTSIVSAMSQQSENSDGTPESIPDLVATNDVTIKT